MENTSLTITLSGESIQILMDSQMLADRFDWDAGRHCNAEFELHIIVSGSCALDVDDQVYPLSVGSAIVIAPNHFHSSSSVTDSFERLSIGLVAQKDSYVADLLYKLSELPVFQLTEPQMNICRQLLQEASTSGLFHAELSHAYLTVLLAGILRMVHPDYTVSGSPWKRGTYQLYNTIDLFFSSWPEPLGSEHELAQLVHLSRRQLNRILLQYYGMTFREKLMRSKMDYAAWLLRTSDEAVCEIARRVGYSTESAFFVSFKRYFGITPMEYRLTYNEKGR